MSPNDLISKETCGHENLERHFRCYLNNKMMVLLMMIEHPEVHRTQSSIENEKTSLSDLERHFLPYGVSAKYHHAFRWLKLFLGNYPSFRQSRITKAEQMVGLVYQAFGYPFCRS